MQMPSRNYQAGSASNAYGYNGKRKDPDMDGNNYNYGFRIYNPQIGKFLSVDPLTKKYPELTPYHFASNRPIDGMDFDGLEYIHYQWNIVSTAKLKNGNTDFQFKNWLVNGKKVEDWQYDKNVSGTVDKNWYLFNNKLYQYPYQIPGYTKWLKEKEEKQQRVIKDGLVITGGIVCTIASAGIASPWLAAFGITSGLTASAGGTIKTILDIKGDFKIQIKYLLAI